MKDNINPISFYPDYTGFLNDSRLELRCKQLWHKLSLHPCSTIRQLSKNKAEQKAYYRFLNNERVEEKQFVSEAAMRMSKLAKGRHLLCVNDTSEINLSDNKNRLKSNSGLGRSDKSDTKNCFKLHPGLVLDVSTLSPLGFSHIKIFHRPEEMPDRIKRDYKRQSIDCVDLVFQDISCQFVQWVFICDIMQYENIIVKFIYLNLNRIENTKIIATDSKYGISRYNSFLIR